MTMTAPVSAERAQADTNITGIAMLGVGGLAIYWYATFTGPFRWSADLQNLMADSYWEPLSVVMTAALLMVASSIVIAVLLKLSQRLPLSFSEPLVGLVLLVEIGGLLLLSWHLWDKADRLPRYTDPVTIVDLDRIGAQPLRTGHVRVVGRTLLERSVLTTWKTTRRFRTLWATHIPLVGHHERALGVPVRLVLDDSFTYAKPAVPNVAENPEGLLLAPGYDNRILYRVRRAGLPLANDVAVLFQGGGVDPMDLYMTAGMIAAIPVIVLVLGTAQLLRTLKQGRRARGARS